MLKINLLPIRQLQRQAGARNELFSFVACFILILLILGAISMVQANKASAIQTEITRLNQEKQTYDKILAEIKKLEADKKELENKISIIIQLKTDSSLTVHVLDEVARKLDSTRIWLTAFDQQGGSLSLKGIALDNKTIAEFMNSLDASDFISDVNLSDSLLTKVAGQDLKAFSLQCAVATPTEKTAKTTQQKK
ncbi:MAG: Tfp pilus assembly protein [Desulfobulbaceae bacterium]|jgi:type IV pilus assembly protein PilN|nr:MAG: Tfp pilus assembly protein [Desulfobulbaceae bacterium]